MLLTAFARRQGRLLGLLLVVAIGVLVAGIVTLHSNANKTYTTRDACDVLTSAVVQSVGGKSYVKQEAAKTTKTTDTQTSFCVYRGGANSVSLVIRSPLTSSGATLNKQAFAKPPLSSQKVQGYGDIAYWTPSFGQFSILKHDQWYILSNGPNVPALRTLQQAEQLAAKLAPLL